jgi:hypothetical protein
MWKEMDVAGIYLEGLMKTATNHQISDPDKIQTGNLPNISQKHYRIIAWFSNNEQEVTLYIIPHTILYIVAYRPVADVKKMWIYTSTPPCAFMA